MKNEKTKRVISGIAIIIITFPILFFTNTPVITVYMLFVAAVGIFELLRCCKLDKWYIIAPAELMAAIAHFICRLHVFGLNDIEQDKLLLIYVFMAAVFIIYLFALAVFKPDKFNIETNGFAGLMCLYVLGGTIAPVMLCELANGEFDFPLIFISAWMTDWFAYAFGSKLGKHKLCPTISPKKTIEGAVGGTVGSVLLCFLFGYFFAPQYLTHCMVMGLGGAIISQFGDLTASIFKRRMGIKDYGNLIPGHGGIMDRFDSILFTAPLVYYYITFVMM